MDKLLVTFRIRRPVCSFGHWLTVISNHHKTWERQKTTNSVKKRLKNSSFIEKIHPFSTFLHTVIPVHIPSNGSTHFCRDEHLRVKFHKSAHAKTLPFWAQTGLHRKIQKKMILSIPKIWWTSSFGKHSHWTIALKHVISQIICVSKVTFGQNPRVSRKKRRQWSTRIKQPCVIPENSIRWRRVFTLSALLWDRSYSG